ncbi:MAG: hypothetical protein HFJ59_00065 [Clostridia bacterium]|nr:hypothetical protein [Clostridia bacterium]
MEEEVKQKKSKSKGIIAIIAVILLVLIAGVIYYFLAYIGTEALYKRIIGKTVNSYQKSIIENDYNSLDTTVGLNVEVSPKETNEDIEKIVDLLNSLRLELNTQIDKEQESMNVKLNASTVNENDNILNAEVFMDVKDEKVYVHLKDFFDKYIEAEATDGTFENLKDVFENMYTKEQKNSVKKSSDIIGNEIKGIIKEEYCSSEKQEITIDGKKVNATKNTISMTVEQLINELLTVFNNLKNNEQFINCYQDKKKVKDILNQYIEELEYDKGLYEDDSIRISVYSTGLLQKVVKVDVEMQEDNQEIAIIEVAKKDEENFEFKIKVEDQTILGTIQATKKDKNFVTGSIKIDIPKFGKVILNIDVNNKFDTTIDAVDTNNVIKENEITQEDAMEILEKFQDSKLYEIVNETSGGMLDMFFNSSNNPSDRGLVFEEEEVLLNDYEEYVNSLT